MQKRIPVTRFTDCAWWCTAVGRETKAWRSGCVDVLSVENSCALDSILMKNRPTKAHNAQHFHVQQQRRKKVERWHAVKSYKRALKETGDGSDAALTQQPSTAYAAAPDAAPRARLPEQLRRKKRRQDGGGGAVGAAQREAQRRKDAAEAERAEARRLAEARQAEIERARAGGRRSRRSSKGGRRRASRCSPRRSSRCSARLSGRRASTALGSVCTIVLYIPVIPDLTHEHPLLALVVATALALRAARRGGLGRDDPGRRAGVGRRAIVRHAVEGGRGGGGARRAALDEGARARSAQRFGAGSAMAPPWRCSRVKEARPLASSHANAPFSGGLQRRSP